MQPTIGRTVHYTSHGSPILPDGTQRYRPLPRAAIITAVPEYLTAEPYDGCPNGTLDHEGQPQWIASLAVLNPTGLLFDEDVPYAAEPTPGHWSWPPRT
ncbi:hypothetical protein [Kitasatospora sp. NPDC004289]